MTERRTSGEQTTMGSGGPNRTARRSAPPHPGSERVRERIKGDGEQVSEPDSDQGGDSGEGEGERVE
jgi:hypothetical protein